MLNVQKRSICSVIITGDLFVKIFLIFPRGTKKICYLNGLRTRGIFMLTTNSFSTCFFVFFSSVPRYHTSQHDRLCKRPWALSCLPKTNKLCFDKKTYQSQLKKSHLSCSFEAFPNFVSWSSFHFESTINLL